MSWLIDNATGFCILLGIIAAGLVVVWRFNGRVKYLGYAAGVLVIAGLIWLLTLFIPTDSRQMETNVHEMARAVEEGKIEDLIKHVSKDFRYEQMTREDLRARAQDAIKRHAVTNIRISRFDAQVSPEKRTAKTTFLVAATADRDILVRAEADFVLEGDQWKLKTVQFYSPIGNKDQPIRLPGLP
jgi:hypothetical protein